MEDIKECQVCRAAGRGGSPISPAVGYCRMCKAFGVVKDGKEGDVRR